jgi:hypothetical protein
MIYRLNPPHITLAPTPIKKRTVIYFSLTYINTKQELLYTFTSKLSLRCWICWCCCKVDVVDATVFTLVKPRQHPPPENGLSGSCFALEFDFDDCRDRLFWVWGLFLVFMIFLLSFDCVPSSKLMLCSISSTRRQYIIELFSAAAN